MWVFQRSSLNVGPRSGTGNRKAGPIMYSFHLPKMSGNSSGWPSVTLDFIALDFPVHTLTSEATHCMPATPHLIDLHWVSTGAVFINSCGMVHVLSACLLDHNIWPSAIKRQLSCCNSSGTWLSNYRKLFSMDKAKMFLWKYEYLVSIHLQVLN